jgi:hypothetical protein
MDISDKRKRLSILNKDLETAKRIIAACEWERRGILSEMQDECAHNGVVFHCPTRSCPEVPLLMCAECGFGGGEADLPEDVRLVLNEAFATEVSEEQMLEACNTIFGEDYMNLSVIQNMEDLDDTGIW